MEGIGGRVTGEKKTEISNEKLFEERISFEEDRWEGQWRSKNKNKVMKNFLRREFLLKRLGGRVSGEVKTDEGKTSPLISVKQLPRSSRVNLKQQSNI